MQNEIVQIVPGLLASIVVAGINCFSTEKNPRRINSENYIASTPLDHFTNSLENKYVATRREKKLTIPSKH